MQRIKLNNATWWFDHATMSTAGVSYNRMFDSAMELLFDDSGIIADGQVFRAAERLIDFDPDSSRSAIGFNRHQAEQALYYRNYAVDTILLDAECEQNLSANGWAWVGTRNHFAFRRYGKIWMNPFVMNRDARANGLPNNATGVDIMTHWIAAVYLHELMHIVGFSHGARIDNTPTHPYNRTLPQVAYRAVIQVSGHATGFFLTGGFDVAMGCGTSASILAYADEVGELPEEVDGPPEIDKYKTRAAKDAALLSHLEQSDQSKT